MRQPSDRERGTEEIMDDPLDLRMEKTAEVLLTTVLKRVVGRAFLLP